MALIQSDWCPLKKRTFGHTERHQGHMCTQRKEDTIRKHPSASQGERSQKKPPLPTPWSWTSVLQKCEKINFCCLIDPVHDILL